jgi:hypothetical protein
MGRWKKPPGRELAGIRQDDELARVHWREFERMMGRWYAAKGYEVEHRGTGTARRLTDGGVDLVLRGHGEKVLVQCKHEKALRVPYNPAMQLRGLIHAEDEPADRAILVITGEFTPEALRKASKAGLLEMIDGKALRALLGPDISRLRDGAQSTAPLVSAMAGTGGLDAEPLAMDRVAIADEPGFIDPPSPVDPIRAIAPATSVGPAAAALATPATYALPQVTARPMSSRVSRGVAAACAAACLGAIAIVGFRAHEAAPEPLATAPSEAPAPSANPPRPAPKPSRRTSHESAVDGAPRKRAVTTTKPKVVASRANEEAARESAPVIYKSSNMSDAEFAAWRLRKAQREQGLTRNVAEPAGPPTVRETPVAAEPPPTDAPGAPAETMQAILRTNRR